MGPNEVIHVGQEIKVNGEAVTVTSVKTEETKSADLSASTKPAEEHKPTRKEIGEWRARNFTMRHPEVTACGHKLNLRQFPRHANCFDCWEAFLEYNPESVASVHDLLLNSGIKAVTAMHGKQFSHMFDLYLRKKLLTMHANAEVQAASGIEGNKLEVFDITKEKEGV